MAIKWQEKVPAMPIDVVEQRARSVEQQTFQKSHSLEQFFDTISDELLKREGKDKPYDVSVNLQSETVKCKPVIACTLKPNQSNASPEWYTTKVQS